MYAIRSYYDLEFKGLPKVQRDAQRISDEMKSKGVSFVSQGALDEYGANGDRLGAWIRDLKPDFALIVGVPHAIPPHYLEGVECFSITNGPRQVGPFRITSYNVCYTKLLRELSHLNIVHFVIKEIYIPYCVNHHVSIPGDENLMAEKSRV